MNKRTTGIIIAILVVVLALIAVAIIFKPFSNNGPDDLDVGEKIEIDEFYDVETGELISIGDNDNSSKTDSDNVTVIEPGASEPNGTTSDTSSDKGSSSNSTGASSSSSNSSSSNSSSSGSSSSSSSSSTSSSSSSSANSSGDESKVSNTNSESMQGMKPWR